MNKQSLEKKGQNEEWRVWKSIEKSSREERNNKQKMRTMNGGGMLTLKIFRRGGGRGGADRKNVVSRCQPYKQLWQEEGEDEVLGPLKLGVLFGKLSVLRGNQEFPIKHTKSMFWKTVQLVPESALQNGVLGFDETEKVWVDLYHLEAKLTVEVR